MYQKYMCRPILYKSVTRVSVVAVLMLLWDRYVSDGTFAMWQAPALLLGVVLLMWAWVNYLRLDGVTTVSYTHLDVYKRQIDASDKQTMGSTLDGPTLRVEYSVGKPRYLEPKTSTSE